MTVLTIYADYNCYCVYDQQTPQYDKYEDQPEGPWIDHLYAGNVDDKNDDDLAIRFPLTNLPANANVSKVRLRYTVNVAGGAAGQWPIIGYGDHGQADPEVDNAETTYKRSAGIIDNGPTYVTTEQPRSTGIKWETLGEGESAQACIDVENAKAAVNRFSLGMYEVNQDDQFTGIYAIHSDATILRLEITYTVPSVGGYSYGDGLVSVSIFALLMRKAILSVCGVMRKTEIG